MWDVDEVGNDLHVATRWSLTPRPKQPLVPMSTTPETPPAVTTKEDTTVALLSYLTPIGFIVAIVMHSSKKTQLGSYHLRQMLGLILTAIVCWPMNIVLAFIPIIGWLCMMAISIGLLALWIMGLISAINGQQKPTPVVGELYQKWFANAFN